MCQLSKYDEYDEHDELSKYAKLSESIAFAQNIEVFYGPKIYFWGCLNSEINVTNSQSGNSRWEEWGHLSTFQIPFLSYSH